MLIQDEPKIVDIDFTTYFENDDVVVSWQGGYAREESEQPQIRKVRMPFKLLAHLIYDGRQILADRHTEVERKGGK